MTSRTGPISAMRPAYITATRSAVSAITPMSWVISMMATPCWLQSRFISAMICACTETSSARVHTGMELNRFSQLLADPEQRVERGERVLEHHADPLAANAAQVFGGEVVDACALQQHLAARDTARRIEQADDCSAGE